jgi:hypothetical protein
MHLREGLLVVAMLFSAPAAFAQVGDNNPLAHVKRLNCTFSVYAIGSWKGGEPEAQVKQPERLSIEIDEIDVTSGSGRVTGAGGSVDVNALLTIGGLHVLERNTTGLLNVTTVFVSDGGAQTFRAVHARHDYVPVSLPGFVSEPSVSQHYGVCVGE